MDLSPELKQHAKVAEAPESLKHEDGDFVLLFTPPSGEELEYLSEIDSAPTLKDCLVTEEGIYAVFMPMRRMVYKKIG